MTPTDLQFHFLDAVSGPFGTANGINSVSSPLTARDLHHDEIYDWSIDGRMPRVTSMTWSSSDTVTDVSELANWR